ncbi:hypothetical protein T459_26859 [Capsicum annuum]|uniref:Uncharacterized protein n=1 Tax=Capsicum annuum TaxID=4072 RepID=A0A2G2YC93_CAPAN|nr:hypothetical protein T459_26859 [Capsicum annuum]
MKKRQRDCCYFYNETYIPGHKCRTSKQLYLLEIDETKEMETLVEEHNREVQEEHVDPLELVQPVEHMEISMHALNGSLGFRTLKVIGYHSKMGLHILIDTGSSHNFIDPELVRKLGCEVRCINPEVVAAANGSMKVDQMTTITWLLQGAEFCADFLLLPLGYCGVVFRFQWLLTLGDIKLNFRNLTMEFWHKGRKHLLRGSDSQVLTPSAGKLAKQTGIQSQLCIIQVIPQGSDEVKWHPSKSDNDQKEDPTILEVLSKFAILFEEPGSLSPSRGIFDHRIVL